MIACRRWANSRRSSSCLPAVTSAEVTASIGEADSGRHGDQTDKASLQIVRAVEEDFALVSEISEERSLRQPGLPGDLLRSGLIEATLAEQSESSLHEPAGAVRFPTSHKPIVATESDITIGSC